MPKTVAVFECQFVVQLLYIKSNTFLENSPVSDGIPWPVHWHSAPLQTFVQIIVVLLRGWIGVRCKLLLFFFRLHTFTNTIKHSRVACYLTCLVRRNRRFVVRLIEFAPTKKTATHREACCFCCDCTYVSPLPNSALAVCTLFYLCFFSFYPKGVSLELLLDLPVALCTE